jgi:glucose-1-phosphate adenylyltransferase
VVEEGADIEDCIIMDYVHVGRGAKLRRVIVDRHNSIEAGTEIGFDVSEDRDRYWVSSSGITVVPRGRTPYYPRDPHGGGRGFGE